MTNKTIRKEIEIHESNWDEYIKTNDPLIVDIKCKDDMITLTIEYEIKNN